VIFKYIIILNDIKRYYLILIYKMQGINIINYKINYKLYFHFRKRYYRHFRFIKKIRIQFKSLRYRLCHILKHNRFFTHH